MTAKITNSLARLNENISIKKMEQSTNLCKLHISFPEEERVCPSCGSHHCNKKDKMNYKVYHSSLKRCTTHLCFTRFRYKCCDCGRTFTQHIHWLHDSLHISKSLYLDVCESLSNPVSTQQISTQNCIPASMVSKVIDSISCPAPNYLPTVIGIDEFKGNSGIWSSERNRWHTDK